MIKNYQSLPPEEHGIITNACIYNMSNAVRASKYPMAADVSKCTDEVKDITRKLANAPRGSGHDNFLHGILLGFDLTLSNKAWVEWERYHFQDIVSSQSTMHRIVKLVDENDPFNEWVTDNTKEEVKRLIDEYNNASKEEKDDAYLTLLYNVPSGLKLTAGIVTNMGQIKTMIGQREFHRLPEWRYVIAYFKKISDWLRNCL